MSLGVRKSVLSDISKIAVFPIDRKNGSSFSYR